MEGHCPLYLATRLCAALTPRISTLGRAWQQSCPSALRDLVPMQPVSEAVGLSLLKPPSHRRFCLGLQVWLLARCLDNSHFAWIWSFEALVSACDTLMQFPHKANIILGLYPKDGCQEGGPLHRVWIALGLS